MRKTPTIFDRDWDGNRGVVPNLLVNPGGAVATEKLDGTNVRVTIRSGSPVRIEARKNPSKRQKAEGITEPWYRDAWHVVDDGEGPCDPGDRYIVEAAGNTPMDLMHDGEWNAEAVGPKIQSNPLALPEHRLYFFDSASGAGSACLVPPLHDIPKAPQQDWGDHAEYVGYFEALRDYLASAPSHINDDVLMEGIVWHGGDGWAKLKRKDYK